jgi:hypothetical protein
LSSGLILARRHQRLLLAQGKVSGNLLRLLELLFQNPIVTIHFVGARLAVSFATAKQSG